MIIYKTVEDECSQHTVSTYISYGISACDESDEQPLCIIPDIFQNIDNASEFTQICNSMKLDVSHLPNVIENYLCSKDSQSIEKIFK